MSTKHDQFKKLFNEKLAELQRTTKLKLSTLEDLAHEFALSATWTKEETEADARELAEDVRLGLLPVRS